ncbi:MULTISPECIES: 3-oxoacyl-ACP synthase III family protein [Caldilinea]|jgi:3-oxoacyl-[acyl-carrier-protein] synthase-3|uniref:3-oxoacyl-[acyl-carrier-protein] synthase III n=1 Tax=Caldilinea aerophila (strain DSM 14535 / JCM 11387 / NBRC 104270 / STL-6-O1) TaxID=926550 RepID=I0I5L7_CALAS|nr:MULTISPECIES: ketoacyl-ACP synthase III [Caldilinea]BAM00555.1 3-oxoacyl-[acyl-carrier-protein] synthase III [Caldilinea aerophila DSM 14535 = NBRC 104270]GIV71909.1 MAG: 3-oxoacyl-[acyl-carrier-protein] synthase 3 [Caldilinea sp.]
MARHATIVGTGCYVPKRVITNADLNEMLGEPVDEWLVEKVGIEERHVMAEDETSSDLAVAASRQALERAGITAADLDLIIVATDTPDYISPATASVVQAKLNARNAGTYDINCACAAWVTGLDVAAKTIAADPSYTYILVVGTYGMSKFVNWADKYTCTLFADGAGAVVLGAGDEPGFLAAKLLADGQYHDALGIYTGGTFRPATPEVVNRLGKPRVEFVRRFPAAFNTERWPPLVRSVVAKAGLSLDDVEMFFFTQLNLRTIEATMAALGQPMVKTHWIMHKWGYTGSACIPMALNDAVEQGKLRYGDHIVFCASGGGLAMAAAVFRWTI